MTKGAWKIAKVNLQNIKVVYFVVGIIVLAQLIQAVIMMIIASTTGNALDQSQVSVGCYLWLLPLLAAISIPARNFRKIVNLGGKRGNFILGSFLVYLMLSLFAALANTAIYYLFDRFVQSSGYFSGPFGGVMNLVEIFGWVEHGVIAVVLQQFAFLLLVAAAAHTLTAIQDKWYGWVTDAVLTVILAVFIPIAPLRSVLIGFFNLIVFQPSALLQVVVCLLFTVIIYVLNKPIYARKAI